MLAHFVSASSFLMLSRCQSLPCQHDMYTILLDPVLPGNSFQPLSSRYQLPACATTCCYTLLHIHSYMPGSIWRSSSMVHWLHKASCDACPKLSGQSTQPETAIRNGLDQMVTGCDVQYSCDLRLYVCTQTQRTVVQHHKCSYDSKPEISL